MVIGCFFDVGCWLLTTKKLMGDGRWLLLVGCGCRRKPPRKGLMDVFPPLTGAGAWWGLVFLLLNIGFEQNGTLPNLEMFRGHDKASYTIPSLSIFLLQALFLVGHKTPYPPIKEIPSPQRVLDPWLKVPYRSWVPAWATCWIATKKLRRPPGSHMTKTTKTKRQFRAKLERMMMRMSELYVNLNIEMHLFQKKHFSWFWICGWTSDKSFASPKTRKTHFCVFFIYRFIWPPFAF